MKNNRFSTATQQSTQHTAQPVFRTDVKAGQTLGLDPDLRSPGLDPDAKGPGLDPDAPLLK